MEKLVIRICNWKDADQILELDVQPDVPVEIEISVRQWNWERIFKRVSRV